MIGRKRREQRKRKRLDSLLGLSREYGQTGPTGSTGPDSIGLSWRTRQSGATGVVFTPTAEIELAYSTILRQTIGEPTDGTAETPRRAALAWLEMTSGYDVDVSGLFKTFDAEGFDEMIAVTGLRFVSLCEHHLLPFVGKASIAYIPRDVILGLSKFPRVVDAYARRLQNQERLTMNVADAIWEHVNPVGLLVQMRATHSCMCNRGARAEGEMVTSVTFGAMRARPETRAEALGIIA